MRNAEILSAESTSAWTWTGRLSGKDQGWEYLSLGLLSLLLLPLLSVFGLSLTHTGGLWQHLWETVLPHYVWTTLKLMIGAGVGALLIGVCTAWFTSAYEFPGRSLLSALLLLPLAMPAYLLAYVWTDLLEYAGPVQQSLRDLFGWTSARDYWFPEIRSQEGAATLFSFVLYPYVFLLARTTFLSQSLRGLETGRMLGMNPFQAFFKVSLPLARPALIVGVSLVLMEVLADFGTVSYFGINTLSKGVFDIWLNMNDMAGAAQLATMTLVIVFLLLGMERWSRRHQRFSLANPKQRPLRQSVSGWKVLGIWFICLLPLAVGFLLPAALLVHQSLRRGDLWQDTRLWQAAESSFLLAASAAFMATLVALLIGYGVRMSHSRLPRFAAQVASMSYAFPGAILALGVLWPLSWFDNTLDDWLRDHLGISSGLLLSGTVVAILFAYVVRFLAVAFGSVDSGLQTITPAMDQVPRLFGFGTQATLVKVHLPLLRRSLLTAVLIVFVDVMKELPATLILRPFGLETLATHVYQHASSEQLSPAAPAALLIVLVGIWPVLMLSRSMKSG